MSITVDASPVLRRMKKLETAMGQPGLRKLGNQGVAALNQSTREAFSRMVDPSSGNPWPARRSGGTWPLLRKSGTLASLISAKAKVLKKVTFIKGVVAEGGGANYHAVANTQFYGRKDGSIPPRPFMGLTEAKARSVRAAARALIRRALN